MHKNMWARTRSAKRCRIGHTCRALVFSVQKALDPREGLVAVHAVGRRELLGSQRGADHVRAVQGRLGGDLVLRALVAEVGVADLAHEALADLVAVQHGPDPQADLGRAVQAPRGDSGTDRRQQRFGGCQQILARVGALGRQAQVAAGHQALAGIVWMLQDLEQADLVGVLQTPGALELAQRAAAQRRDPVLFPTLFRRICPRFRRHEMVGKSDESGTACRSECPASGV